MKGKIFNAQEVQAIIAGNKTMFREVIKPQIIKLTDQQNKNLSLVDGYTFNNEIWADLEGCKKVAIFRCPYQVGQKIFCKETFEIWDDGLVYKADNSPANIVSNWKPAQHMKQEHSRLTLLIKEIRVERLAGISEEDAIKEGNYLDRCKCLPCKKDKSPIDAMFKQNWCHIHGQEFKHAWNATHKKPEEKFQANPWVFVYTMEVVK
jgi:hypothetical protein